MDVFTIKHAQLTWTFFFFFKKEGSLMKPTGAAKEKKKGLNRKCVGYGDESAMYGLCKTYAWASEFPDLLSWSLSRRGGVGCVCTSFFLLLWKSFLLHSHPAVGNLQKSSHRQEFLQIFSLLVHLAQFKVSQHIYFRPSCRVTDLTSKKPFSYYSVYVFFLLFNLLWCSYHCCKSLCPVYKYCTHVYKSAF